jgi:hypothetical protein
LCVALFLGAMVWSPASTQSITESIHEIADKIRTSIELAKLVIITSIVNPTTLTNALFADVEYQWEIPVFDGENGHAVLEALATARDTQIFSPSQGDDTAAKNLKIYLMTMWQLVGYNSGLAETQLQLVDNASSPRRADSPSKSTQSLQEIADNIQTSIEMVKLAIIRSIVTPITLTNALFATLNYRRAIPVFDGRNGNAVLRALKRAHYTKKLIPSQQNDTAVSNLKTCLVAISELVRFNTAYSEEALLQLPPRLRRGRSSIKLRRSVQEIANKIRTSIELVKIAIITSVVKPITLANALLPKLKYRRAIPVFDGRNGQVVMKALMKAYNSETFKHSYGTGTVADDLTTCLMAIWQLVQFDASYAEAELPQPDNPSTPQMKGSPSESRQLVEGIADNIRTSIELVKLAIIRTIVTHITLVNALFAEVEYRSAIPMYDGRNGHAVREALLTASGAQIFIPPHGNITMVKNLKVCLMAISELVGWNAGVAETELGLLEEAPKPQTAAGSRQNQ